MNRKRKLLILALVVLLVLALAVVPVLAGTSHGRVTVCKNGKTVRMNSRAAGRQFTYGRCP